MSLVFDCVTFAYRWFTQPVLREFSWVVPEGRTVLLGPNGAGKSTLLALGADALRPRSGRVHYGGSGRTARSALRRKIGWMPQQIRAFPGLTVQEQVAYAGWLKGLPLPESRLEAANALTLVGLDHVRDRAASALSGGEMRRLGIAQTLTHHAEVLLLDEPTAGLDPAQRARFRSLITSLPRECRIVVSTHQVDDLSAVFDRVVVMHGGQFKFAGSVDQFLHLGGAGAGESRAERAYVAVTEVDP